MCAYGISFVPVNLLLLLIGVLLYLYAAQHQLALPADGDQLFPMLVLGGHFGSAVIVLFTLGISAAAFSSVDSALTALTTSYCVDIRHRPDDERLRRRVHLAMCACFVACILAVWCINSSSLIDAIYTIVSYTYGPLLGLFAYSLFTHRAVADRMVPFVCVASPLLCFGLDALLSHAFGYHLGYELLLLNGMLTFLGLFFSKHFVMWK
jgi:Na+/proline symporter